MPKIILEGPEPFDLVAQREPSSIAERGTVAMTLPVCAADFPEAVFQIRVLMTPDQADYVSSQLRPVATTARMQLRYTWKSPR